MKTAAPLIVAAALAHRRSLQIDFGAAFLGRGLTRPVFPLVKPPVESLGLTAFGREFRSARP